MNNNKVNTQSMIYGNGKRYNKNIGFKQDNNARAMADKFAQNALKQTNLDNIKRR